MSIIILWETRFISLLIRFFAFTLLSSFEAYCPLRLRLVLSILSGCVQLHVEAHPSFHNNMDNNTNTSSPARSEFPLHFRIIKIILYVIIFVTSVFANILVCMVILRRRKMKTVTNYFILNLAVADLTLTCICIPFDIPVQELNYSWPYGSLMRKILYPLQTFLLFVSVYTLTAVSLARQRAIVHPLKTELTTTGAKIVIVCVWFFAIVPVTPYFRALKFNPVAQSCEESWHDSLTTKVYPTSIFFFQYILPFCIMFTAYFSIGRELKKRAENGNQCLKDLQEEEARKVVRMLKVVTTLFAFCLLPNNIMWLWLDFGKADKRWSHFWDLVAFSNILILANSAANPICYTIYNENYRQEMKNLLNSVICRRHDYPPERGKRIAPPQCSSRNVNSRSSTLTSSVWSPCSIIHEVRNQQKREKSTNGFTLTKLSLQLCIICTNNGIVVDTMFKTNDVCCF